MALCLQLQALRDKYREMEVRGMHGDLVTSWRNCVLTGAARQVPRDGGARHAWRPGDVMA